MENQKSLEFSHIKNDIINGKPFLKWVGSKRQLAPYLKEKLTNKSRLIEPFVGSGAVFMATDYKEYILSDINPDLIHMYQIIKDDCDSFIEKASSLFTGVVKKEEYYFNRKKFNESTDKMERACLFLYLNKYCFNGVCRYNSKGGFNVPMGEITKNPSFPESDIRKFSHKLNSCKTTLIVQSFELTMKMAKDGDVVYCDPPYYPLTKTENFVNYHTAGFGLREQELLAKEASSLKSKGVDVFISNNPTATYLYPESLIEDVSVGRFVGGKNAKRGKAKEIIAIFKSESVKTKKDKLNAQERIILFLKNHPDGMKSKDIACEMNENIGSIRVAISNLKKEGRLSREKGFYKILSNDSTCSTIENDIVCCQDFNKESTHDLKDTVHEYNRESMINNLIIDLQNLQLSNVEKFKNEPLKSAIIFNDIDEQIIILQNKLDLKD